MTRHVTLVCGPPCAGKTSYVRRHAQLGDLVLDQDTIGARAMGRELPRVARMTAGTAWIIRTAPGPRRRAKLANDLGADVVLLAPPKELVIQRAKHRVNARRTIAAIGKWYRQEALDTPPPNRVKALSTTRQRGYGGHHRRHRLKAKRWVDTGTAHCWRCGGWIDPRSAWHLGHDDDDRSLYRGPEHERCNTSAAGKRSVVKPLSRWEL